MILADIKKQIDKGFGKFQEQYIQKIATDIERLLTEHEEFGNDLRGLVIALYVLKEEYGTLFNTSAGAKPSNEIEIWFAETSKTFLCKLFAEETMEQLHREYAFELLYETDMYYPNVLLYMDELQGTTIPVGYYFRFEQKSGVNGVANKTVYIFVDQEETFGEIISLALTRLNYEVEFTIDLIPLDYVPSNEKFSYIRISDVPVFELGSIA